MNEEQEVTFDSIKKTLRNINDRYIRSQAKVATNTIKAILDDNFIEKLSEISEFRKRQWIERITGIAWVIENKRDAPRKWIDAIEPLANLPHETIEIAIKFKLKALGAIKNTKFDSFKEIIQKDRVEVCVNKWEDRFFGDYTKKLLHAFLDKRTQVSVTSWGWGKKKDAVPLLMEKLLGEPPDLQPEFHIAVGFSDTVYRRAQGIRILYIPGLYTHIVALKVTTKSDTPTWDKDIFDRPNESIYAGVIKSDVAHEYVARIRSDEKDEIEVFDFDEINQELIEKLFYFKKTSKGKEIIFFGAEDVCQSVMQIYGKYGHEIEKEYDNKYVLRKIQPSKKPNVPHPRYQLSILIKGSDENTDSDQFYRLLKKARDELFSVGPEKMAELYANFLFKSLELDQEKTGEYISRIYWDEDKDKDRYRNFYRSFFDDYLPERVFKRFMKEKIYVNDKDKFKECFVSFGFKEKKFDQLYSDIFP